MSHISNNNTSNTPPLLMNNVTHVSYLKQQPLEHPTIADEQCNPCPIPQTTTLRTPYPWLPSQCEASFQHQTTRSFLTDLPALGTRFHNATEVAQHVSEPRGNNRSSFASPPRRRGPWAAAAAGLAGPTPLPDTAALAHNSHNSYLAL